MKYRSGFVTNSSSSSYVVAYKKIESAKTEKESTFLNKLYSTLMKGLFDYRIETEEDLVERILTLYGCDKLEDALKNEYVKNYYETTVELIRDGYVVAEREIDYNDFDTQGLIESLIDDDNIILLREA